MKQFEHISEVWEFLDNFKTPDEMEDAFGEIPSKFGSFDITNTSTYQQEGFIEICNSYFDNNVGDYDYDYHCVSID